MFRDRVPDIQLIANALTQGAVAALPTETVYGLAAHALNETACRKVFSIKGRPLLDPLIVHVASLEAAKQLAYFNPEAEQLAQALWPGPLTLVLPQKTIVPDLITAGQSSVAIRVPSHPLFRKVLEASQLPLAAPSANPFGQLSPTRAEHVQRSLGNKIEYILDGGPCAIGIESTIVDMREPNSPHILRFGAIDAQALSKVLGVPFTKKANDFPGSFKRHYSPDTRLLLLDHGSLEDINTVMPRVQALMKKPANLALVYLKRPDALPTLKNVELFWLSETGDLAEVAQHLFDLLHTLDQQDFNLIAVERPSEDGLGIALNDRLSRAATI